MGFIGKLAKMAAGVKQTHVKGSKVDMKCRNCTSRKPSKEMELIRQVLEIIQEDKITGFFDKICHMVQDRMMEHSEQKIKINVILFDFHGAILGRRDSE